MCGFGVRGGEEAGAGGEGVEGGELGGCEGANGCWATGAGGGRWGKDFDDCAEGFCGGGSVWVQDGGRCVLWLPCLRVEGFGRTGLWSRTLGEPFARALVEPGIQEVFRGHLIVVSEDSEDGVGAA